ncbi:MAG: elongation factor P [Myxococcota bacterium]
MADRLPATQVRKGHIVVHEGALFRVVDFEHRTQGRKQAFVGVKLRNLADGTQRELKLSSNDVLERARIDTREMELLYTDGSSYVFMDGESYEQSELGSDLVDSQAAWLSEGMRVTVEFHEGRPIGVQLPRSVEVVVAEAEPVVRGQTAARSSKPATLANGVAIQVPTFVQAGDRIRVDTSDGHYLERVQ